MEPFHSSELESANEEPPNLGRGRRDFLRTTVGTIAALELIFASDAEGARRPRKNGGPSNIPPKYRQKIQELESLHAALEGNGNKTIPVDFTKMGTGELSPMFTPPVGYRAMTLRNTNVIHMEPSGGTLQVLQSTVGNYYDQVRLTGRVGVRERDKDGVWRDVQLDPKHYKNSLVISKNGNWLVFHDFESLSGLGGDFQVYSEDDFLLPVYPEIPEENRVTRSRYGGVDPTIATHVRKIDEIMNSGLNAVGDCKGRAVGIVEHVGGNVAKTLEGARAQEFIDTLGNRHYNAVVHLDNGSVFTMDPDDFHPDGKGPYAGPLKYFVICAIGPRGEVEGLSSFTRKDKDTGGANQGLYKATSTKGLKFEFSEFSCIPAKLSPAAEDYARAYTRFRHEVVYKGGGSADLMVAAR